MIENSEKNKKNKKDNINVLFGLKVKEYRKSIGASQEQLGYMTGLHRTYIGHIERAEKNITLKNIEKIADSLGIDIKDLFDFSNLKTKKNNCRHKKSTVVFLL